MPSGWAATRVMEDMEVLWIEGEGGGEDGSPGVGCVVCAWRKHGDCMQHNVFD